MVGGVVPSLGVRVWTSRGLSVGGRRHGWFAVRRTDELGLAMRFTRVPQSNAVFSSFFVVVFSFSSVRSAGIHSASCSFCNFQETHLQSPISYLLYMYLPICTFLGSGTKATTRTWASPEAGIKHAFHFERPISTPLKSTNSIMTKKQFWCDGRDPCLTWWDL